MLRSLLIACGLSAVAVQASEVRTWMDVRGRSLVAEVVSIEGDTVVLRRDRDRQDVRMRLADLSATDRNWLILWQKDQEGGDTTNGVEQSLNGSWPGRMAFPRSVQVETDKSYERAGRTFYCWYSDNFRFVCDEQLDASVVAMMARMFEGTHAVCEALPLGLRPHQLKQQRRTRYPILLFSTKREYLAAGGAAGSSGSYDTGRDTCLVPLESIGVRKAGRRYVMDSGGEHSTLVHEITHQLTGTLLDGNPWFREGLAEYVAVIPQRTSSFDLRGIERSIVEYLTRVPGRGQAGRSMRTVFTLPSMESFLQMDQGAFIGMSLQDEDAAEQVNTHYAGALMWFCYFAHDAERGDGEPLKRYARVVLRGGSSEEANEALLGARDFDYHERMFSMVWKRRGLDVKFAD
ncbi:hypothetical protein [Sulfuriroseicoccus oceanibius]|uniref:DUF1570 domain-containing protein n=1 Tax=Sulfuriroseicoccus oceanibius TaxID=2707525 RepID=A0A6B3L9L2_9BACT|nr:hypothetical protein [Sulfuriroseicoccus oceanibius]QQL46196.1 hypothetical protein G3M56_006340 [Sulfuriroseicoccus oceanibius]